MINKPVGIRYKNKYAILNRAMNLQYVKLLILHMAIAFCIYVFEPLSLLYFLGVMGYFLFQILEKKNRNNEALMAAAYIAGAEIFLRMTSGIIFYETGKYAVILFLVIGMFFKGASSRSTPFWIYLLILVPGIVVASQTLSYDAEFRKAVAFNLSGPVCLGVSAIYCYYKKITKIHLEKVVALLLMPIITTMTYLYLYTPRLDESLINVGANYAATAGYGPNQISTIMGMGAFLLITRLFVIKNKIINVVDLLLLILMSYRAIVTFSRGGVITALICAIAFLILVYYKRNHTERSKLRFKVLILIGVLFFSWMFSAVQTSGLIVNRYTNRDAAGRLEKDITTGRAELITSELQAFYHYPVVGIGVGKGKEYRYEMFGENVASHNEISRLLSEHGLLGVVAVLILIFVPLLFWLKFKNNYYFLAFVAFWFLTINHSAMRIALPGFVYGLALLYIVDDKKKPLFKKSIEA